MPRQTLLRLLSSRLLAAVVFVALVSIPTSAHAGSHLWRINELFSNADGTVQFIELKECCGANNENGLSNKIVHSVSTGLAFTFPSNLPGGTANKTLLLATAAFAAAPGAPTPDHIIPDGLIDMTGDTIWWGQAQNYDSFTFSGGQMPVDGVQSMEVTNFNTDAFVTGANTPTNFAGGTGSIDVSTPPVAADFVRGDCNEDGSVNIADPVNLLTFLFPSGAPIVLGCGDACDANDDGSLNVADAVAALSALFGNPTIPLPAPSTCGPDLAADTLTCDAFAACP